MNFDRAEIWRIERANLALLLHKTPAEIDAMPARDVEDLKGIQQVNDEHEAKQMRKAMKR